MLTEAGLGYDTYPNPPTLEYPLSVDGAVLRAVVCYGTGRIADVILQIVQIV